MNLLILAANGQIARLVEDGILQDDSLRSVHLTLGLREPQRLSTLSDNPRVTLIDVDIEDATSVQQAMVGQDMVFVAVVDHDQDNAMTTNVIKAMRSNQVNRVVFTNILGLYDEVPGEFGAWNKKQVAWGLPAAINSDRLLNESGLDYTTLRLPWLNDRDEVKYQVTTRYEPYLGVSVSRKSVADLVIRMVKDPDLYSKDSIGLADPQTQGETRPVY
ncbi:NAD(P)H-binding protein [Bombiscardovia coagulans]|uniref:Oxidoreductase n=1 Tax=Bombiscardovia coagulans TaxID=686666 RepID=A0A261ETZ2_9BIFI|nr:NAD(P)H-binding protein [Bombiscardovia coagulans]OZG50342.1 oxidoreductase [Bombiscardovia coagulans]